MVVLLQGIGNPVLDLGLSCYLKYFEQEVENKQYKSNSPSQDYTHPDDDMTPGFKPFTILSNTKMEN